MLHCQFTHAIGSHPNGTEVVGVDANLVCDKMLLLQMMARFGKILLFQLLYSFAIADLVKTGSAI
jgi:hypothetical protein